MLKSSLCYYSDAYILVKGTIKVANTAAADADAKHAGKKVIFKDCAPFTDCINEINKTQIDRPDKDISAVNIVDIYEFNKANVTDSFNFNEKITG